MYCCSGTSSFLAFSAHGMARASRDIIGPQKRALRALLRRAAKNDHALDAVLRDILTPKEYDEIARRWQIVQQVADGVAHRTVARNLHVSISKVTRGARAILDSHGGFSALLPPRGR